LYCNLTSGNGAIYNNLTNSLNKDGHKIINCTFEHIRGTSTPSPAIYAITVSSNVNVSDCVFNNISHSGSPSAGAIYYNMSTDGNGHYNISGNSFFNISTNKSVLVINGIFTSLLFSYNCFCNVSSVSDGGVYFILF
jgi:hypothetical protein